MHIFEAYCSNPFLYYTYSILHFGNMKMDYFSFVARFVKVWHRLLKMTFILMPLYLKVSLYKILNYHF